MALQGPQDQRLQSMLATLLTSGASFDKFGANALMSGCLMGRGLAASATRLVSRSDGTRFFHRHGQQQLNWRTDGAFQPRLCRSSARWPAMTRPRAPPAPVPRRSGARTPATVHHPRGHAVQARSRRVCAYPLASRPPSDMIAESGPVRGGVAPGWGAVRSCRRRPRDSVSRSFPFGGAQGGIRTSSRGQRVQRIEAARQVHLPTGADSGQGIQDQRHLVRRARRRVTLGLSAGGHRSGLHASGEVSDTSAARHSRPEDADNAVPRFLQEKFVPYGWSVLSVP